MKNTIKFIAGIFIIGLLATTAPAQHLLSIEEGRMNDNLTVRLSDLDNKRTAIHVIGVDGKTWMTKYVHKQDEYVAGLDLSLLPDGNYLVTTENQRSRQVKAFHRSGQDITLFQPKTMQEKAISTPRLVNQEKAKEGQLIVRINQPASVAAIDLQLANLKNATVDIHLISLDGIPVFTEQVSNTQGYVGRLDMENVGDGTYVLCVQTPEVSLLQLVNVEDDRVSFEQTLSREQNSGKGILMASRP